VRYTPFPVALTLLRPVLLYGRTDRVRRLEGGERPEFLPASQWPRSGDADDRRTVRGRCRPPEPSEGEATVRSEPRRGLAARLGDIAKLVGTWFILTTLTIWCGAIVAYLVLHGILFTLGQGAASVGLFVTVLLLEVAPFAWAMVILRRARRSRRRD
jgi:hypothetical protein